MNVNVNSVVIGNNRREPIAVSNHRVSKNPPQKKGRARGVAQVGIVVMRNPIIIAHRAARLCRLHIV
jgi:hypothetical protein